MNHACHAIGCTANVPPRMFACRRHWFALRRATQQAIWREYRHGQEIDKRPSTRYLAVQRFAVAELARLDGFSQDAAGSMDEAMHFRQKAIDEGAGDPLLGLMS